MRNIVFAISLFSLSPLRRQVRKANAYPSGNSRHCEATGMLTKRMIAFLNSPRIRQFLLVLWAGLFSYSMKASTTESLYFTHIGLVEGLSHSTILAINQDQGGNLWFATYDGVNKYDGYNFTVYRHQHTNPNSIASDISHCLAIDDTDRIWVGTREGLSLYNPQKNAFSNYYYKNKDFNVAVTSILPLQKDLLMLGTAEGILLFDARRECFLNDTLPIALHRMKPTALIGQGACRPMCGYMPCCAGCSARYGWQPKETACTSTTPSRKP